MPDLCTETLRVLAHELRRPLTVIRGAATLLVDDAERLPPATREQMLTLIDNSAAAMADQVDDLLVAVHLETGDLRLTIEPVAVSTLVTEAVEAVRRGAPDRAIDVMADGGLVGEVEVDRDQALRALRAVLVNAVHFSPEHAPIELTTAGDSDVVTVLVLDRGPGIPAQQRERAFEKFTRLNPQSGGAGLGLFLARSLVRRMGGEVTVGEREDGGAAVCFTLKRRV